jgi:Rrf2 family protein
VRVSAKADYALRGVLEIAAAERTPIKRDEIAAAQRIPVKFLEVILGELRHAGIVASHRGSEGGYSLARPADEITVADVIRAIEGPLASVRDMRPEELEYEGAAAPLREVFVALRMNMREVLESVTLADIVAGRLSPRIEQLIKLPEAWRSQ